MDFPEIAGRPRRQFLEALELAFILPPPTGLDRPACSEPCVRPKPSPAPLSASGQYPASRRRDCDIRAGRPAPGARAGAAATLRAAAETRGPVPVREHSGPLGANR